MLKKKTNILSAEGQRAAPGFGAKRFKKLGYSNVEDALAIISDSSNLSGIADSGFATAKRPGTKGLV